MIIAYNTIIIIHVGYLVIVFLFALNNSEQFN